MRTDELISELSAGSPAPRRRNATATMLLTVAIACLAVAAATSVWLGLRTDLDQALSGSQAFVFNARFIVCVGTIAMTVLRDLSVPGRGATLSMMTMSVPFAALGILALHEAHEASFHQLWSHDAGASLVTCFGQALMLAVPAFAILTIGVRYLAPTNLRRAGFYLGLLAGAIAAFGFCLHDRHESFAFSAALYVAGIMTSGLVGAVVGPRVLRWR
jgi:hypothetical protein